MPGVGSWMPNARSGLPAVGHVLPAYWRRLYPFPDLYLGLEETMETAELKILLPKKDLDFAEWYAREHQITVAELIDRYLQRLQAAPRTPIHPDVQAMSGLLPAEVDAEGLYYDHLVRKHGGGGSTPDSE